MMLLLGSGLALTACDSGGGESTKSREARNERQKGGEEESGGRRDVPGVPAADRLAYYQVATTTGTLRLLVSGSALGRGRALRPAEAARLRASARRLRAAAPLDPALKRALAELRPAVGRVARARVG